MRREVPFFIGAIFGRWVRPGTPPSDLRWIDWDEDDPEPPQTVAVPNKVLADRYDPDELLGYGQVYAAQVCVLDACLEVLLDWLRTSPLGRETLLVVTSSRGFPMGEHLRVGASDGALFGELTQIPLMLRFPDALGAADRSPALVQPSDLAPTLAAWHDIADLEARGGQSLVPLIRGEADAIRECIGIANETQDRALVTPAWYLRQTHRPELFLRPDDRWAANDVADRCSDIVDALALTLKDYSQAAQLGCFDKTPPLSDELLNAPE